jgi:Flp pilus assembly protein TadB
MSSKAIWSWIGVAGLIILTVGALLAYVPYAGIALMAIGTTIMIISVIVLIPILIRERKEDNRQMRNEITERELRP